MCSLFFVMWCAVSLRTRTLRRSGARISEYAFHSEVTWFLNFLRIFFTRESTMADSLTKGAIEQICTDNFKLILQVLDLEMSESEYSTYLVMYDLVLSNGHFFHAGLLVCEKNKMVEFGQLKIGFVIRRRDFCSRNMVESKFNYVYDLDIMKENFDIIGNPDEFKYEVAESSSSIGEFEVSLTGSHAHSIPIVPIEELIIDRETWTIRVRVTHKGNLKKNENNRGRGTIFAFDFLDARDCQI